MELRQLEFLAACAQTKSFSKAASLLYTSQSNVSKTIATLEQELGKKLFERKQYGIELTAKGKEIYAYAQSVLDYSAKIFDCAREDESEELRLVFQPSSWFASAFCEYYLLNGSEENRYRLTSAPVDEIIRRVSNGMDQLGFAYIEDSQLSKLMEVFRANHLGFYSLKQTKTVLYYGDRRTDAPLDYLPLIQGTEDRYSGMTIRREKASEHSEDENPGRKMKVVITTNSDYIMQEILRRTELGNISPEYLSHGEKALRTNMQPLGKDEQSLQYICLFRNDVDLDEMPRKFLIFIKKYIME